jgi:hypothetical protein
MKNIALFVGLLSISASLQAQDTTYDWTGTGGFTAMITLDSPSSTGGGLSDIGPWGPFTTYPVEVTFLGGSFIAGPDEFDGTTATLTGPFTWDASQITSMSMVWDAFGDDWLSFGAGATAGQNYISYTNLDVPITESDNTGLWQAQPDSVPDAGNTSLLLGIALAGLGGFFAAQRKLAPVKVTQAGPA